MEEEEEVLEKCVACGVLFPEDMALLLDDADFLLCPDCYDIWEWEWIETNDTGKNWTT